MVLKAPIGKFVLISFCSFSLSLIAMEDHLPMAQYNRIAGSGNRAKQNYPQAWMITKIYSGTAGALCGMAALVRNIGLRYSIWKEVCACCIRNCNGRPFMSPLNKTQARVSFAALSLPVAYIGWKLGTHIAKDSWNLAWHAIENFKIKDPDNL